MHPSCLNIYAPSCLPFMSDYLWFHIIWLGGVLQSQWSIMQKYICGRIAWGEVPVTVCYAMAIRKPNMASIVANIPWAGSMVFSAYVSSPPPPYRQANMVSLKQDISPYFRLNHAVMYMYICALYDLLFRPDTSN